MFVAVPIGAGGSLGVALYGRDPGQAGPYWDWTAGAWRLAWDAAACLLPLGPVNPAASPWAAVGVLDLPDAACAADGVLLGVFELVGKGGPTLIDCDVLSPC